MCPRAAHPLRVIALMALLTLTPPTNRGQMPNGSARSATSAILSVPPKQMEHRLVDRPDPVPPKLRCTTPHASITGTVVMTATISRTGRVIRLRVLSGPDVLRSVSKTVRQWRYRPYEVGGRPVPVRTRIIVPIAACLVGP